MMLILIRIVYVLNIIVAGQISLTALWSAEQSAVSTFQNAYAPNEVMRLVGCLWLGIALISVLGLWKPLAFSPILLLQLIYKGTWLIVVAYPAIQNQQPYPKGMAAFFLIWVLILPFVIPWKHWWEAVV